MNNDKKIVIVGGGPIGLSLALGLKDSPHQVVLIDKKSHTDESLLKVDTRMIALSKRSIYYLESIGMWESLKSFVTPIKKIHISEKGFKASVLLDSKEHQLDDFGGLIPLGRMLLVLSEALKASESIEYMTATTLIDFNIDKNENKAHCKLLQNNHEVEINADWVISAEGTFSYLREKVGIETFIDEYKQVSVIASGIFEKPHNNVAYERFTSRGPLALLPINTHEMAIVLVVSKDEKRKWQEASEIEYAYEIMNRIGSELGDLLSVTRRHVWELSLMLPKKIVSDHVVLVGNSAHALHPIAGQGLNLGFRDIEYLLPYFRQEILPTLQDLEKFERERKRDIQCVVGATDFLVKIFGIDAPMLPMMRNIGLKVVKHLPFLKKKIAKFGMGL